MISSILNKDEKHLKRLTELAQELIFKLHIQEPENQTFEQEGILNGSLVIKDFIEQNEIGLAIEHLLYMVYESDISYPTEGLDELNRLASKYGIKNFYKF